MLLFSDIMTSLIQTLSRFCQVQIPCTEGFFSLTFCIPICTVSIYAFDLPSMFWNLSSTFDHISTTLLTLFYAKYKANCNPSNREQIHTKKIPWSIIFMYYEMDSFKTSIIACKELLAIHQYSTKLRAMKKLHWETFLYINDLKRKKQRLSF